MAIAGAIGIPVLAMAGLSFLTMSLAVSSEEILPVLGVAGAAPWSHLEVSATTGRAHGGLW
jgi:hypothetical protein